MLLFIIIIVIIVVVVVDKVCVHKSTRMKFALKILNKKNLKPEKVDKLKQEVFIITAITTIITIITTITATITITTTPPPITTTTIPPITTTTTHQDPVHVRPGPPQHFAHQRILRDARQYLLSAGAV